MVQTSYSRHLILVKGATQGFLQDIFSQEWSRGFRDMYQVQYWSHNQRRHDDGDGRNKVS